MKYDAETFRQFLLDFQALTNRHERREFVIDALNDVDGMLYEHPFIRGLSQYLWAQTMGNQMDPATNGTVNSYTDERFQHVADSIEARMRDITESVQAFFYGMIGRINFDTALGKLTPEELAEYQKPYPKEDGLVIRGKPGTDYVLWKHEGKNWTEVRILLEKPSLNG